MASALSESLSESRSVTLVFAKIVDSCKNRHAREALVRQKSNCRRSEPFLFQKFAADELLSILSFDTSGSRIGDSTIGPMSDIQTTHDPPN